MNKQGDVVGDVVGDVYVSYPGGHIGYSMSSRRHPKWWLAVRKMKDGDVNDYKSSDGRSISLTKEDATRISFVCTRPSSEGMIYISQVVDVILFAENQSHREINIDDVLDTFFSETLCDATRSVLQNRPQVDDLEHEDTSASLSRVRYASSRSVE